MDQLTLQDIVIGLPHSVWVALSGRAQAYRLGTTAVLHLYGMVHRGIDSFYVDGLSLTHGTHVSTFGHLLVACSQTAVPLT